MLVTLGSPKGKKKKTEDLKLSQAMVSILLPQPVSISSYSMMPPSTELGRNMYLWLSSAGTGTLLNVLHSLLKIITYYK